MTIRRPGASPPAGQPHHRARKSLGQNFLVDRGFQRRIVEALGAGPEDEVLEIGPGRGALTDHLVGQAARLVLVELDDALAASLQRRYTDDPSVEVIHADILSRGLASLTPHPERLKVIGNIPYNVTTPILFHVLEPPRPASIVLMVQEEVADRISAPPGGKTYGALSVGVGAVARVERVMKVPRGVFRPVPGVDSAVIRIVPLDPPPIREEEERFFRVLVRSCFQWRRKQLGTILRDHPELREYGAAQDHLETLGIDPRRRPETLEPGLFLALARALRRGE